MWTELRPAATPVPQPRLVQDRQPRAVRGPLTRLPARRAETLAPRQWMRPRLPRRTAVLARRPATPAAQRPTRRRPRAAPAAAVQKTLRSPRRRQPQALRAAAVPLVKPWCAPTPAVWRPRVPRPRTPPQPRRRETRAMLLQRLTQVRPPETAARR